MEKVNTQKRNVNDLNQDIQALRKEVQEKTQQVTAIRQELFNLKLTKVSGQIKDYSQFKKLRKKIATGLFVLNPVKKALQAAERALELVNTKNVAKS